MAGLLDISSEKVEKKLEKLSWNTGVSIQFICWDQMRLWINDIIRKSAPGTLSQGRNMIQKDVNRLFVPIKSAAAVKAWRKRSIQEGGDIFTTTKSGRRRVSYRSLQTSNLAKMKRIHQQNRSRRDGRVHLKKRVRSNAFGGEFIAPERLVKMLTRDLQKKVGLMKAHFGVPAQYYATKTRGKTPAYDKAWIERHALGGRKADKIGIGGTGFIEAINDSAYAARKMLGKSWWRNTEMKRQRDLTRGGFKRMSDLARRFNAAA